MARGTEPSWEELGRDLDRLERLSKIRESQKAPVRSDVQCKLWYSALSRANTQILAVVFTEVWSDKALTKVEEYLGQNIKYDQS